MTCEHEYTLALQSEKIAIEDAPFFIFNNDGRDVVGRMTEFNGSNDKRIYKTSYLGSKILNVIENISLPLCTSVGYGAFEGCSALATVILRSTTRAKLDSTNAFSNCPALTGIYVPDSLVSQYKAATNWSTYAAKIKPLSELPS